MNYHLGCITVGKECEDGSSGKSRSCTFCRTWQSCADWCYILPDCSYWRFDSREKLPKTCLVYKACKVIQSNAPHGEVFMGRKTCHSSAIGCTRVGKECTGNKLGTFEIPDNIFEYGWKRCGSACYNSEACHYWQVRPKDGDSNKRECDLFNQVCTGVKDNPKYISGPKSCNGIGIQHVYFNVRRCSNFKTKGIL